jgi:signal transduction histidine kinase/ligand-binding sensor domain-containing protein
LLHQVKRVYRRQTIVIALGILLACCSCTFALNPSLDINQYAHTAWKSGEVLPAGIIKAIAQTPDGYLWLGTEFGVLRFDGVRAVSWEPPAGEHLPTTDIRSLVGARDGRLWIGTFRGLVSWRDGKLTHYPELDGQVIEALLEDREGTIWVAGWAPSAGRLCSIQSGQTQCHGADGRFGYGVTPLYEDRHGTLWVGAMNGLWRWKPGPPTLYPIPDPAERIYALTEIDDGGILVAKRSGITKLKNGKIESYPTPLGVRLQPYRLLRDRDGSIWIGNIVDKGLLHIHDGRTDFFTRGDGLSDQSINALFEDRERNIWVATESGLDRFREYAVYTVSVQQGLSSQGVSSILAAKDGALWLGTADGLNRLNKGEITVYRKRGVRDGSQSSVIAAIPADSKRAVREITDPGLPEQEADTLFEDNQGQIWVGTRSGVAIFTSNRFVPVPSVPSGIVYGITTDGSGNIWISHEQGLLRLNQERVVETVSWADLGRSEPATAVIHDGPEGSLWLGFRNGGVAHLNGGQSRASYGAAEGLGEGFVQDFYADRSGALWVATEGGLSRIREGRVLTLTNQNGLPCNTVHWMREDDAGSVWLYMACGLIRVARSELDAWTAQPKLTIHGTVFDSSDGVSGHRFTGGYNSNVATAANKLWFCRVGGVSVIDPHNLPINELPPPVHVEQVIADGTTYDRSNGLRLPAGVRDLMFDFTALSFVIPEKVRIRVMLEGQDESWRELINQRRVHYTNLPPRSYRFRVVACNNSGVCNQEGGFLDFSIAPAFYQRTSFRALCVIALLALVFAVYELRVRQLASQFNKTLEARVSERTRIARDLHDTLLQSFQGLLLRFQSVSNVLPGNPQEAKQRLARALDQASDAITEGRNAVQGLRSSAFETNDLASGIIALGQELTGDEPGAATPVIDVVVEGATRNLNPMVRDEAYRIAGEALRNAIQHAEAQHIRIEIRYDRSQFRLRVRDDGKGIDDATLRRGHAGHFGLHGMRERAEIVRGRLEVWSKLDTGTEIELRVPGAVAYGAPVERSWFSKIFSGRIRKSESTEHE